MPEITGLWIPLEYLRNNLLTGNERLIVSYIKFREKDGTFEGTNREIGTMLNMKDNRVSEGIFELIKKGFLERENRQLKVSEKWKHSEKRKLKNIPKSGNKVSEKRKLPEIIPYSNIKIENDDNKEAKNEKEKVEETTKKSVKVSAKKTSLPETEFLDSEFKDFQVFEKYIKQAHPEIDTNFYYHKISSWIDKNTGALAKRKIWKSTVQQFLENDYKKGELVTTKSKSNGKQQSNNSPKQGNLFEQQAAAPAMDDLVSQYFANQ